MSDRRVMDYPTAHEHLAATRLGEHDERCSYRLSGRAVLCDCWVLDDEYARRRQTGSEASA